jgi:hypothetical protein
MNITTRDIQEAVSTAERYYSQPQVKAELIALQAEQKKEEDELAKMLVCREDDLDKIRDRLGSLDGVKVRRALTDYFFDGATMKVMFCLIESILAHQGKLADGALKEYERIRHWLRADKQIGAESIFGYAMTTSFDGQDNLLVAKAPRPGVGAGDSIHEYIVGAFALNNLRSYLPNFAYVFGTFDCASPVIGLEKEIDTWCGFQPGVHYVLYENVNPSVTLGDLNKTISFPLFLNYYLQVLLALRLAHKKYDFTHYDLHDQNVLVRALGRPVSLEYETPRGVSYLETEGIATIIDYGQSHVKIGGKNYGYFGLEAYGPTASHSFPIFDAYKLLLMSMRTMFNNDNPAWQQASSILRFFTTENPVQVIKSQSKFYYSLPRTKQTLALSLDELIDYILKIYPQSMVTTSLYPLLKCKAARCQSPRAALKALELSPTPKAGDMIELYDLATKYEQEGRIGEEKLLLQRYPYNEQIGKLSTDFDHHLSELERKARDFSKVQFGQPIIAYRRSFDAFAEMVDVADDLSLGLQALQALAQDYQDDKTLRLVKELKPIYQQVILLLMSISDQYLEDALKIKESVKRERGGRKGNSLPEKMRIPWVLDIFPGQVTTVIQTLDNAAEASGI